MKGRGRRMLYGTKAAGVERELFDVELIVM